MLRRLLARFRRGGSMPSYRSRPGEQRVILSPGRVQLPPGAEDRFPPELIDRINQGRQP
ncbi:hypothetical protein [Streptomyces sp. MMG1533]|uniref:hypothetical protein n=1 Tax=Streptomyces sp. MMG1533 TaxID=1415546 RepID=UPI000A3F60DF|nr:hypothetical protein [Streptomyces sp. MMG1533]